MKALNLIESFKKDATRSMYTWVNKDGSNMTGAFSGGKLDMKTQFNLK